LLEHILPGDVVVADRYHCTWWQMAQVQQRGADAAFRLHARRHCDFRRGTRLGRGDHLVSWPKPARPAWMDEQTYESLPSTLLIREVRVTVSRPGYRVRSIVVCATLVDAKQYPREALADLYDKRWHVELDIRAIKQTLKMDILSCKTPQMVRKEVWTHLLAYNLTRKVMAQAAALGQITPRQLSFAGAVQTLNAFRWLLVLSAAGRQAELGRILCLALRTHEVGNRPGRWEPRKVKRRPKPHARLMRPRAEERERMSKGRQG
jgi:Transposase DDE domain